MKNLPIKATFFVFLNVLFMLLLASCGAPHDGVYETSIGTYKPKEGLVWMKPNDSDNYSVKPADGYKWADPENKRSYKVVPIEPRESVEMHDHIHKDSGSADRELKPEGSHKLEVLEL